MTEPATLDYAEVSAEPVVLDFAEVAARPPLVVRVSRGVGSAAEWLFGLASLILGLAILAALPVAQFFTLGYLMESSARVARSGRLRDGFVGIRRAARVGGLVAGITLSLLPLRFLAIFRESAELIDPGGPQVAAWKIGAVVLGALTFLHVAMACLWGGRLRHFLLPIGHPFWLVRSLRRGRIYARARDGVWEFVAGLRPAYYFRLGLIGFLGTMAWLVGPALLIAAGGKYPALGLLGALWLAIVAPWLPFVQVRYAVERKLAAFFRLRPIRDRFRRAPWAFAVALPTLLLASIPLYLLKVEMIPREAAWLPSLVFVAFLAPARLLIGWAYHRSGRRDRPRHWAFRVVGRLMLLPTALFYVLVVFLSQYTTWSGVASLYEQHAFLLPVPFLNM